MNKLSMILLFLLSSPFIFAVTRPNAVPFKSGCELWIGMAAGNDSSVLIELQLCNANDKVTGILHWSSLTSGWNKRKIVGHFVVNKNLYKLKDTHFISNKPNRGWRYCLIDFYELKKIDPHRLSGHYWSSACNDTATLVLDKQVR